MNNKIPRKKIGYVYQKKPSYDYYKKFKSQYNKYHNHLRKRNGILKEIDNEIKNNKINSFSTFEDTKLIENKLEDNSNETINNISNINLNINNDNNSNLIKNFSNIKVIKTNSKQAYNKYDNIENNNDLKNELINDEIIYNDYNSFYSETNENNDLSYFLNKNKVINLSENDINSAFYIPKNFKLNDLNLNIQNQELFKPNIFQSNFINKPFYQNIAYNINNKNLLNVNKVNKSRLNNKSISPNQNVSINQNSNTNDDNKLNENTEILNVNIKISKNETLVFNIRRYDDMFRTVKIFCEINKINTKLLKPLILHLMKTLNYIFYINNTNLTEKDINYLNEIKTQYNNV